MKYSRIFSIGLMITGLFVVIAGLWWSSSAALANDNTPIQQATDPAAAENRDASPSTADHTQFEELQQEFATGPEVTAACLQCHTEAASQMMATTHWTWEFTDPQSGAELGKNNVINNYCVAVSSNEPRCTSCHVGYGYTDNTFDFTVQQNVDCLVCHDTTGKYKKFPAGAGHPVYGEPREFPPGSGKIWEAPDLTMIAQNVGKTSRDTCGACHFNGGGGNGVKHGDLDQSLKSPSYELDVHMDASGLNFDCATCHAPEAHAIPGSRYQVNAKDEKGIDIPGNADGPATCESCHGLEPHPDDAQLNHHVESIACQTCHIPSYARGEYPTKMWWDWSTAGLKNEDGKPYATKDDNGWTDYDSKKGDFIWEKDVQPEYYWFNGDVEYQNLTPFEDGTEVAPINIINGGPGEPGSRIWPFKVFRGIQPYDSVNNTFVVPHLFGKDENAYWKAWDWDKAIASGMESYGADYSGEFEWIETEMYWPVTHMVAPATESLDCNACHTREKGILHDVEGIYIPGLSQTRGIDTFGWGLSLLALVGVVIHGSARVINQNKNGNGKKKGK